MEKTRDFKIVATEVDEVLKAIPKNEYNKIPNELKSLFKEYRDPNINVKIDLDKGFEKQEISKQAKDIIFIISLNYWLTEEEKKKVIENMEKNEEKFNEKYDIENIFRTNQNQLSKKENHKVEIKKEIFPIVYKKDNWCRKIINKLKKILKIFSLK